jgi:glutathione-regulated potassium-efflux system ancillary protein KefG
VISTGGREDAYRHGGHNRFTMRELLAPIEQTFVLCGMTYLPPFVAHGAHGMTSEEIEARARNYRRAIEALRDGKIDLEAVARAPRLDFALDELIAAPADPP